MKKWITKKRVWLVVIIIVLLLIFFPTTCARPGATVKLNYYDMHVTLNDEESARVAKILNGNVYDPPFSGVPACGFGGDITIEVGLRTFVMPEDWCNKLLNKGNLRYFNIPEDDMDYIHSLFDKYGKANGVQVIYNKG